MGLANLRDLEEPTFRDRQVGVLLLGGLSALATRASADAVLVSYLHPQSPAG